MIEGNTQGIRQSTLDELELLHQLELPKDEFLPVALIEPMALFTQRTGRELSIYLGREGNIVQITVGDQNTVPLEAIHLRRNQNRLAGVRCIHTHPGGDAMLSSVDINSLKRLHLDAMAAIGVRDEGGTTAASAITVALIESDNQDGFSFHGPYGIYQIPQQELMQAILELDKRVIGLPEPERLHERCILVGLCESDQDETLQELRRLSETAGAEVVMITSQNRGAESATYIGKGKAQELSLAVQALDCDLVIFNDELTGAQIRNLEEILGVRVVDRAALILDIFALHARSREGKLQVELAQLQYKLPRLIGSGVEMSRIGGTAGAIGTRGPGETKLEIDRRRIRERISDIRREIKEVSAQRALRRTRRESNAVPVVALVGYTNAGKSTLLNRLTGANVLAEDKLFATLDTTTRALELPSGAECLITDTVGFIDKLPHDLVDAFRSTLEEAMYADLLVIVCDASSPNAARQYEVVQSVLDQLNAGNKPFVLALNKNDIASADSGFQPKDAVPISAKDGFGVETLLAAIERKLDAGKRQIDILIPYDRSSALAFLHREGAVQSEQYEEGGTRVQALLNDEAYARIQRMLEE